MDGVGRVGGETRVIGARPAELDSTASVSTRAQAEGTDSSG